MGQNRPSDAEAEEDIAVVEAPEEISPFRYFVEGEKVREDAAFFELLLARVIRANGGLSDFDEYWPRAVRLLAGLNICRLSNFSGREIEEAVESVGGGFDACLAGKTDALIHWAESFWRIRQIYGSFRQYIRSFDNEGFDVLMADMHQRLEGLSVEFLTVFLREAGEKGPESRSGGDRSGQRSRRSRSDKNGNRQSRGSGRRRGQKGNAKPQTANAQPEQAKSPEGGEQKSTSRNRRGRFFRRKRNKSSSNSTPA